MLVNIKCLVEACEKLKIDYRFIDKNQNVVQVNLGRPYYFANWATPFNNDTESYIFQDKEFTYQLLKDKISMPRTLGFLDPDIEEKRKEYLSFTNYEQITDEIVKTYGFPVIVKRNKGAGGAAVFKCENEKECVSALSAIFNKNSKDYDYVVLAQEYLQIKKEYRVVVFNNEIIFAYLKDISSAKFVGNLSPLHWEGARAVLVEDTELIEKFNSFLQPVYNQMSIGYAGFDLAIDHNDKMWLLEINSKPAFDYFVRDNGTEKLSLMYEKMLGKLQG